MPEEKQPVFMVSGDGDPAVLRINGRANYLNCSPVSSFFQKVAVQGPQHVIVDFANCSAIDSTFLGVLAGAALEFQRLPNPRSITLVRLGQENRKLVRELGLERIVNIAEFAPEQDGGNIVFRDAGTSKVDSSIILKAHEDLCRADSTNEAKFEDVLAFLRERVSDND